MPIPVQHVGRHLYHFTHIDNLAGILDSGFLCKNDPGFPADCLSVAEDSIQARRARMEVPCGPGGVVHDYVPLYFGSLSPMLLSVIHRKNVDQYEILYFEFPITLLERDDVVFTDASANTDTPPNFFEDPADLVNLNWAAIDSRKWSPGEGREKNQRMAEALVFRRLRLEDAERVVVWNQEIGERVQVAIQGRQGFPEVAFQGENKHWFTEFHKGDPRKDASIITGPKELASECADTCRSILETTRPVVNAPFTDLSHLLRALRADFGCTPQTAEIVGLQSDNDIHEHSVDVHTLQVVDRLRESKEFAGLQVDDQQVVELAAFLHDIGKGPRSRWDWNKGVQKVDPDHPARALPMLKAIFTELVGQVEAEPVSLVVQLVCYHDLVGDVLGKGRDECQLKSVARDVRALDLLFMLSKADIQSLRGYWWNDRAAQDLYDRCRNSIEV